MRLALGAIFWLVSLSILTSSFFFFLEKGWARDGGRSSSTRRVPSGASQLAARSRSHLLGLCPCWIHEYVVRLLAAAQYLGLNKYTLPIY